MAMAVLCLAATLAGCGLLDADEDDAAVAGSRPTVKLWTQDDLKPFSPAAAVDGVAVALATDSKSIYVVALDPASGSLLWRHEASPSSTPRGIAMDVASSGSYVAYLAPAREGSSDARMRIVSARTGTVVASSPVASFLRMPEVCDDEPGAFCARVLRDKGHVVRAVRMRPGTSRLVADPSAASAKDSQPVGDGGLSVLRGSPQRIAVIKDRRQVWSREVSALMGPHSELNYGWNFDLDEKADRFVGTVGRLPSPEHPRREDLGFTSTAAFTASSGKPLWRDEGSSLDCMGRLDSVKVDATTKSYLRCRYKGTQIWHTGGRGPTVKNLNVALERFDPATGKTIWAVPLGSAKGLVLSSEGDGRLIVDDRHRIITSGAKRTTVDLVTGKATITDPETLAWCVSSTKVDDHFPSPYLVGDPSSVYGGELAQPCDVTGVPVSSDPVTWPTGLIAGLPDGVAVVASPAHFAAYGPGS